MGENQKFSAKNAKYLLLLLHLLSIFISYARLLCPGNIREIANNNKNMNLVTNSMEHTQLVTKFFAHLEHKGSLQ
jgi:hypothetical protein